MESSDMDLDDKSPRGTKRKVDEIQSVAPRRIKALDQDVVNKIAAGEIIVAPVNALKELIENAVDAGSTSVEILAKDGGLKLLQISDNGHGVNRDDLPILCERFTTSKLKAFDDLTSIGTYGFRGEALASISHIAHLTITTKTSDSNCAWRAHYADGKLVAAKPGQSPDPKPTAGRQGTQITVEDLFYNIPTRRRAFRSSSEEYAKILDIVGKYAVHCTGVAFSCKKQGDSAMGISVPASSTTLDRMRHIHGNAVASELIAFAASDTRLGFTAEGWATNANYHVKRSTLLLFINHRAVESSAVKKAIEHSYSTFLPKGGHPLVYLSLDIDPKRVDVNVHPTKREVNFLNEEEIIDKLCSEIRLKLANVDTSRTFMTQSLLSPFQVPAAAALSSPDSRGTPSTNITTTPKTYENNLVRTDPRTRKITSMLPATPSRLTTSTSTADPSDPTPPLLPAAEPIYTTTARTPIQCRLTAIKTLRAQVRSSMHSSLTDILASHTYVGLVDPSRRLAAIQAGVKLYLVDYARLSRELFYQLGLTHFGNFGEIRLEPPLDLEELLRLGAEVERARMRDAADAEAEEEEIDWPVLIKTFSTHLLARRDMLLEYFSLDIRPPAPSSPSASPTLHSLPLLLKGYTPPLTALPTFLLHLVPRVVWTDEQACFDTFLRQLAGFHVPPALPAAGAGAQASGEGKGGVGREGGEEGDREEGGGVDAEAEAEAAQQRAQLAHSLEHVLFPAFKARLVATREMVGGCVEVANLKGLYRVFERC